MAEFQIKYQQILQGVQPQNTVQQKQEVVSENKNNNVASQEDSQKMVLDYLYEVHGITPQQFQWEFEEYCRVIKEREQKLEQEVKQRVREKISEPVVENKEITPVDNLYKEAVESAAKEESLKPPANGQKFNSQNKGGNNKR